MILVVGGGLAGLTATTELARLGHRVRLVERARSVGGRLATRHMGRATADIGAQFFTVRSDEFARTVEGWVDDGVVEEWCRGFRQPLDGHPRYLAVGGMRSLAHYLGDAAARNDRVEVITRTAVEAVLPAGDRYIVTYEGGRREPDEALAVVLAVPTPEALPLLDAGPTPVDRSLRKRLDNADYHRTIAVVLVLAGPTALGPPGARQQPDDPVFSFIADNRIKGISAVPTITFHLANDLSEELWEADDAQLLARIHDRLRQVIDGAAVTDVQVKRWRHASPVKPFDHACDVISTEPTLILAGDAYAGSKVEGAFRSGMEAAGIVDSVLDVSPSQS